jgi:hypothetical protein
MNQNLSPSRPDVRAGQPDRFSATQTEPHSDYSPPAGTHSGSTLLDAAQRYQALYHDLPALRTGLGTHPAHLVEVALGYVFDTIGPAYERELEQSRSADEYQRILHQAAREAENRFRTHPVFRRQLVLDEAQIEQITRLIPFQLAAYLDAKRCFWLRD